MDASWVDRIHTRLLARYGSAWIRMWDGVDMAIVKADWARELQGCTSTGIAYALDHLPPDRPPNAAQFRQLCINVPPPPFKALPRPQASPERKAEVREMLARVRAAITASRPTQVEGEVES